MRGAPVLSRKLVLETRQDMADGMGGFSVAWVELGALWAQVTASAGRETRVAGRDISGVTYRVVVRAAAVGSGQRPRPDQRFREGARVFNIQAVSEADPSGRFLQCRAEEGRA